LDKIVPYAIEWLQSNIIAPVILEVEPPYFADVLAEVKQYAFEVPRTLLRVVEREFPLFPTQVLEIPLFSMVAGVLPREVIFDFAEDFRVRRIYPDQIKFALQYPTVPPEGVYRIRRKGRDWYFTSTYWTKKIIGADVANQKGFTGRGVKVAVLDTGASYVHEQLRGKVEGYSAYPGHTPVDANGHGTWCAACIAGKRGVDEVLTRLSGKQVVCEGMAPGASLLTVKVLDYVVGAGSDSAIIKGLEIALTHGAKVVSMSLGGAEKAEREEDDPYYSVFNRVVEAGVIPVVAAGNEGPKPETVGTPGALTAVLTVGALDPIGGGVARYSSRGPTPWGSVKPDVVAPGGGYPDRGIDSAITGLLDRAGDGIPSRYSPIQGTSMATPHTSGLLACAAQMYRDVLGRELTVEEVKRMMEQLGHPKTNDDGWGLITWQLFEQWVETQYGVKV
jgi:hypothetical protein